jgi:hypothetical protein
VVHVGNAFLGRHALLVCALAIGAVDGSARRARLGFEKPARDLIVAVDERCRLLAPDMAMDINRKPLAAGMRRSRKTSRDRSTLRQAFEQRRLSLHSFSPLPLQVRLLYPIWKEFGQGGRIDPAR